MKIKVWIKLWNKGEEIKYKGYHAIKAHLTLVEDNKFINESKIVFPPCKGKGTWVDSFKIVDKKGRLVFIKGYLIQPIFIGAGVLNLKAPVIPTFNPGTLIVTTGKKKSKK